MLEAGRRFPFSEQTWTAGSGVYSVWPRCCTRFRSYRRSDEPAFTGCLVRSRLLGVIKAEQTEKSKIERNDRLIAVASKSRTNSDLQSITDLNPKLLEEIEHFFISYNKVKAKNFKPLGRYGRARMLVLK